MAGLEESGPRTHAPASPLSALARRQYAALAAMRWQMFRNSLRTTSGAFELGARTVSYLVYSGIGFGMSVGLGVGAFAITSHGNTRFLPFLFWAVFSVWQFLPIVLASFQEQFDLGILLRFPLGFPSYFILYIVFGLIDISTITGGLCSLGIWVGTSIAQPSLSFITACALLVFAGFNILLVRAVFAWIDRWLAQRRTREIVGALFLVFILSLQLLNPALRQGRHSGPSARSERIADQRRAFEEMRPWFRRLNAVQRWLPPGLAAQGVTEAAAGAGEASFDSLALVAMYALSAGVLLAVRLSSEYAGESLGQAPARKVDAPKRSLSGQPAAPSGRADTDRAAPSALPGVSGPVAAVIEKEFRALIRTLPLIYAVGAPLFLMVIFAGAFNSMRPGGHAFPLALPACLVYALLGFTQLFYNSLGAEGAGMQLYFLSPTPIRTVMLAKNLFHSLLFGLTGLIAGILAVLRVGAPPAAVIAASLTWLLFALPCNLAAGNFFSLTMAYRVNPGRIMKQRGSQANNLISVMVQLGVIGIGALVFWLCWAFDNQWLAVPIFLLLAIAAVLLWRFSLSHADTLANQHKERLIETLVKSQ